MSVVDMDQAKKKGSKGGTPVDPETNERVAKARAALEHYRTKNPEATWKQIARELGGDYSYTSINLFATGNYPASPLKIVEAIERWADLKNERAALVFAPGFVETSVAKKITRAVRQIRTRGRMGIVAAESGIGKSTALRHFCSQDPRTIYLMADPTLARKAVWLFLARLRSAMGFTSGGKTPSAQDAYAAVVEALKAAPKMLVFDEAQFLPRETLDLIRCLHEAADVPVVFSGNETLYEFGLLGGMSPAAFTQFRSRCTVVEQISRRDIRKADAVLVAAEGGVDPDLAEDFAEPLYLQTQQEGGFRSLVSLLQRAHEIGRGQITEETLAKALAETDRQRRGGAR